MFKIGKEIRLNSRWTIGWGWVIYCSCILGSFRVVSNKEWSIKDCYVGGGELVSLRGVLQEGVASRGV